MEIFEIIREICIDCFLLCVLEIILAISVAVGSLFVWFFSTIIYLAVSFVFLFIVCVLGVSCSIFYASPDDYVLEFIPSYYVIMFCRIMLIVGPIVYFIFRNKIKETIYDEINLMNKNE